MAALLAPTMAMSTRKNVLGSNLPHVPKKYPR
jgi:hypothetical protein